MEVEAEMDRRGVVASLALIPLISAQAVAQDTGAPGPGSPFNENHITQTNMVGSLLLETSRMALEKSQNRWIRQFAGFEVAEQEGMADVLKALVDPQFTATLPTRKSDVNAAPSLGPQSGLLVDKLSKMNGAEFEKNYIAGQVEAHQQLLQIQETLLRSNQVPREQVGIAKLAQSHIQEHLVVLRQLPDLRG
jgi:predicted outer membrane protein